jgi:hypothetical protein
MAVESIQIRSTLAFRLGLMVVERAPWTHDILAVLISPEWL